MHWIDPDCLPATGGTIDQFLVNLDGQPDGLLLTDGTEVHFPPHMAPDVLAALSPGAPVTVRGVRPRGVADVIAAVALETAEGRRLVDGGPGKPKPATDQPRGTRAVIEGTLRRVLHGPRGEPRGVLLEDGRAGRFSPHAADALAALLTPGGRIALGGDAVATRHGTVLAIRTAGPALDTLTEVAGKPPKPRPAA